ncbi:MAG: hypothetical protein COC08_07625 [Maribacter sp.]|nr:MAG: hypothetical protein COC08_07625 [Maribacter sp.]
MILSSQGVQSQKIIKKSILNPSTSFIQIDLANCFKINLETRDTNEILVEAIIDGEYKEDLVLNIKEEGSTILISTGFQPSFVPPNDKLSAHKVVSISLKVFLPKYKKVQLYGTNCNVFASGAYRNLKVSLNDGQCTLFRVSESVEVITQSGNIFVNSSGATITANSKYGTVQREQLPSGGNQFKLNTTTGNIHIRKSD